MGTGSVVKTMDPQPPSSDQSIYKADFDLGFFPISICCLFYNDSLWNSVYMLIELH